MVGRKQFDVERATDAAMTVFWRYGYHGASLERLTSATGLGKGSLYGTFGDKGRLFVRSLDRYAQRYHPQYDAALAECAGDPVAAVRAFFGVTLRRFADPDVPDGCLIVQSVMSIPTLEETGARRVRELLAAQREKLATITGRLPVDARTQADLAGYLLAINESLAVLDRAGSPDLEAVVETACATIRTHASLG